MIDSMKEALNNAFSIKLQSPSFESSICYSCTQTAIASKTHAKTHICRRAISTRFEFDLLLECLSAEFTKRMAHQIALALTLVQVTSDSMLVSAARPLA